MSKRTPGERIAQKSWGYSWSVETLSQHIDRAIRREQAKAWEMGALMYCEFGDPTPKQLNPYRGRKK